MSAKTDIFNLALDAAGNRNDVSAPDEGSREAKVCLRWYDTVVDQVLAAAPWPSATAYSRLAVLSERDVDLDWTNNDPDPGWRFAYALPSDLVLPRNLSDFGRFVISLTNEAAPKKAIMAHTENAILTYTRRLTDIALWDVSLRLAIIRALAAVITMPLQGKPDRAELNLGLANQTILEMRVAQANLNENQLESIPEWLSARGFGVTQSSRYYYPFGPLLAITEGVGVL